MNALLVVAALFGQDPSTDLGAPPDVRSACVCKQIDAGELPFVRGIAIDGEVRLDATGRKPLPRQATVFRVLSASGLEAETPFRVWHSADPDACGVTFDYGKLYVVPVRKSGDVYETDECLLRAVPQNARP